MNNLNNLYNFKNPIRHFFNLDNIKLPENIENIELKNLSWTSPIKFRIRKDDLKFRVLKFPNILNYICAVLQFEKDNDFYNIDKIDINKRCSPNIITGDFKVNSYSENLEIDFERLCIYDNLIKLDIKSFYGRIYLHNLNLNKKEQYINNLNDGKTNEIILGNYLSLYLAECFLKIISDSIISKLEESNIKFKLSYFSDDFYIFCNRNDNENVIKIFDSVLSSFDLERNEEKTQFWSYDEYSNYNLVEKYWKKITSEDKSRFRDKEGNLKEGNRIFYFINQLIYRKNNLKDVKLQKVFITNFFKSNHFNNLEWDKYDLKSFNCHQLFSMFKFSPEILLYTIPKFRQYEIFNNKIGEFLEIRYEESLSTNFFDEQLYYFYALKTMNFDKIIKNNASIVLKTENQLLQSYYLMYNYFDTKDIEVLKTNTNEDYWFVNYHLILYNNELKKDLDDSIRKYLIPKQAIGKGNKEPIYINFYKCNIQDNNSLICDINKLEDHIDNYISEKIKEREKKYFEEKELKQIIDDYEDPFKDLPF